MWPAGAALVRRGAELRWLTQPRVVALLLAVLPALWLSWPVLRETPLSHDHATHLFKAWHFWEEMLGRGRLRGWSHFWAFGTPTDELVPFGSELWVALFRAATFGQLSWPRTYALAFAGLLIFQALAAYAFARSYLSRAAAVLCAWITLLDPGAFLEGGWSWNALWGVWPVTLALSLVLMSLAQLERVLRTGGVRHVLWAGLWCAASLLTHPMALLTLAVAVPLLLLDHTLRAEGVGPGNVCRALGALVFGVALASFYLVPFVARSGVVQDLGWLGDSLPAVSRKLVQLRTFQNTSLIVHGLALLGVWLSLSRALPGAAFLVGAGGVFVLLSSGVLIRDLHLERVLPSLIKIEANRFLLVAKPFWFALAGHAAAELARPLIGLGTRAPWRRWVARALGAALALSLLVPGAARHLYETQLAKDVIGEAEVGYFADLRELLTWTRQQRLATDEHYRIAYYMWRDEHLPTLAPVFDGSFMYKVGYTPVQVFEKVPTSGEPELLEALSVKFVVSAYPLEMRGLREERRFGQLHLYRFERYHAAPCSMIGPGQCELLDLSPEHVRFQLSGTSPESRLRIHIASFDRWQASIGGEPLPIRTVPALGAEYPMLMEAPARDGELELDYVYRGVDWFGLLVTLAAAPGFVAICWLARRPTLLDRCAKCLRRLARPLGWAALIGLLSLAGAAFAGTRTRQKLLPPTSLFRHLPAAGRLSLAGTPCVETAPAAFQCGAHPVKADVVAGYWGLHLCMTAPDAGELRLVVPARLGSALAGHYDPVKDGTGSIRVSLDGAPLGTITARPASQRHQRFQLDTRHRAHQQALVEVVVRGTALACFDLEVLE
jgi:hypothetical protein